MVQEMGAYHNLTLLPSQRQPKHGTAWARVLIQLRVNHFPHNKPRLWVFSLCLSVRPLNRLFFAIALLTMLIKNAEELFLFAFLFFCRRNRTLENGWLHAINNSSLSCLKVTLSICSFPYISVMKHYCGINLKGICDRTFTFVVVVPNWYDCICILQVPH